MRWLLLLSCTFIAVATRAELLDGRLFPAITLASDHRFNGMSLSDRNPALQLSVHWWWPDDCYAGIWISNVDFLDANNTTLEVDSYIGRNFTIDSLGKSNVKLEVMYSAFNDDEAGPSYDFAQAKVEISKKFAASEPWLSLAWSPEGSYGAGRTLQMRAGLRYRIAGWLRFESMIGRGFAQRSSERNYYEIGLEAKWHKVRFGMYYAGMDTDLPLCRFVDWCEDALVARITLATY